MTSFNWNVITIGGVDYVTLKDCRHLEQAVKHANSAAHVNEWLEANGMVAVPVEPTGDMVKAALHTIPTEWGVCTGRQMMDIYEAMATAAGEVG